MGRIFETRKATMFARWDKMSKAFTRIGKEITIAVKKGGPDPANNPQLRRVIQNARAVNMPKDKVESGDQEGLGPGRRGLRRDPVRGLRPARRRRAGRDARPTTRRARSRNVRAALQDATAATWASTGSVAFQFKRMGVFRLKPDGLDAEALELELIDHGLEEMGETHRREGRAAADACAARSPTSATCRRRSRTAGITPISAESEYIPHDADRRCPRTRPPRC